MDESELIISFKKLIFLLKKLFKLISYKRKIQLLLLFILMITCGVAEMLSIIAVIPFLKALSNPNGSELFSAFNGLIKTSNNSEYLFLFTVIFIVVILFAALVKVITTFVTYKFSALIGCELSCKAYKAILYQPYEYHTKVNSNKLIVASTNQTNNTVSAIEQILQSFLGILIIIFLTIEIFRINPVLTFCSIILVTFVYLCLWKTNSKSLSRNSYVENKTSKDIIRKLSESIGSIKEIIIASNQKTHVKNFRKIDLSFRLSRANSKFLTFSPKSYVEALGIILISLYGYFSLKIIGDSALFIPKIGAFALAAQKLVQAFQLIYSSWGSIKSKYKDIEDIINVINLKVPDYKSLSISKDFEFNKEIEIKNLDFRYSKNDNWIFSNINLNFKKGDLIGIKGKTGEGKSTFMNIIMSLIKPTNGEILIDGEKLFNNQKPEIINKWRKLIALVPQDIFLLDDSIINNIIFDDEQKNIDLNSIRKACKIAQIDDFIQSCPLKYNTIVGEKGIRLSGGQKQRIGLARAIYKNPQILFLDEATSALDEFTEKKVIDSLVNEKKLKTIFMISHRLSTLDYCNKLIEIKDQKIYKRK